MQTEETNASPTAGAGFAQPKFYEGVRGAKYYLIQTVPQMRDVLRQAAEQKYLAIDTEGTAINWVLGTACGISLGWGKNNNYYFPFAHRKSEGEYDGPTDEKQLTKADIVAAFNRLLSDPDKVYFMANAKHDTHVLRKEGITLCGTLHDVVILSNMVDENGDHGIKELAIQHIDKGAAKWEKELKAWRREESSRRKAYANVAAKEIVAELKKDEELVFKIREEAESINPEKRKVTSYINAKLKLIAKDRLKEKHYFTHNKVDQVSYDYVPLDIMAPYACSDVDYTFELAVMFLRIVMKDTDLKGIYSNEIQLNRVLTESEWYGMKVDRGYLEGIGPDLDKIIEESQKAVYEDVGYAFNLGSAPQLLKVFAEKGIELNKITKGSQKKLRDGEITQEEVTYAADAEVLERLAAKYPFAKKVVDYREAEKLKGTYRDGALALLDENDYIHSSFNQNVSTGRMSSKAPNLQNLGSPLIKRAYTVPSEDYIFVFIDYSQIELRILAHLSQDPNLLACYPWVGTGTDVHSLTAAEAVMGISVEQYAAIMADEHHPLYGDAVFARAVAKRVNFGISYGANKYTIMEQVSTPERPVSPDTCQEYIDGFFNKYRFVKKMIANNNKNLHNNEYVQNEFGRYRRFPGISDMVREMDNIRYRKDAFSKARKRELFPKIARAERQANNFLIQGLAADVFKQSVVRVDKLLHGKKSRICNYVHDELQFYMHKSELGLLKNIKKTMEDYDFSVPLRASMAYSKTNWAEKKELKLAA